MPASQAERDRRKEWTGMAWNDWASDPPLNPALLTTLPSVPCFLCGERGICSHRQKGFI